MGRQVKTKIPVCENCGMVLKGKVPIDTHIICYFCNNPPFNDSDDENTALQQRDKYE